MNQEIYGKLAHKLDAIPNSFGFPQTESRVEVKILVKIYTLEEAALASGMQVARAS